MAPRIGLRPLSLRNKWPTAYSFAQHTPVWCPGGGGGGRSGRSSLREFGLPKECLPLLRRVRKGVGSRLAGVAGPGTAGHDRANRRIGLNHIGLWVQNDPLFRSSNGFQPVRLSQKWISACHLGQNTTFLRPGAALWPGGCRGIADGCRHRTNTNTNLRELCFANECLPVLRRVSKRLGSRPGGSALPGTLGHCRANRRIDGFV